MKKHLAVALVLLTFLFTARAYAEEPLLKIEPDFRVGAGFGIPYGGLGVNFETALIEYFSISVGIGYTTTGSGWALGFRGYPLGRDVRLSPRVGAYQGIIGAIEQPGKEDETHVDRAYSVGLEYNFDRTMRERKDSLDFEVLFLDYEIPVGYDLKGGDVKFSIGYRFRF